MNVRLGALRVVAASVLAVSAVAGCAGVSNNFRDPEIQLGGLVLRGAGLTGGTVDLLVDVYNPNGFDLRGTRFEVGVDVEKSHLGDIVYDQDFSVQDGDTTRLTLPLTFQWTGVGGAVRSALLGYGDLPYTLNGRVTLNVPGLGDRAVSFTRSGRAPIIRRGGGPSVGSSSDSNR